MAKRAMDIVVGSILAVLVIPMVLLLAVGVAITLRTNPFFVQQRVGRGGRRIPILKLRTLPPTAPRYACKYDLDEVITPRFTRALRRLHLDELPQLFLVPFGYMSLVGPRPEMAFMHADADPAFLAERTGVRPGCTGLWQISEAADGLIWEAPEYDRFYLRRSSATLDIWIMWRTALLVTGLGRRLTLDSLEPAADTSARGAVTATA